MLSSKSIASLVGPVLCRSGFHVLDHQLDDSRFRWLIPYQWKTSRTEKSFHVLECPVPAVAKAQPVNLKDQSPALSSSGSGGSGSDPDSIN